MEGAMIPDGYIPGLSRDYPYRRLAHLYKGTFADPGLPMCIRGWNRDEGTAYSIWRGQQGTHGICRTCLRRANAGLEGVQPRSEEEGLRRLGAKFEELEPRTAPESTAGFLE